VCNVRVGVQQHARFKVTAGASCWSASRLDELGEAPWRSLQARGSTQGPRRTASPTACQRLGSDGSRPGQWWTHRPSAAQAAGEPARVRDEEVKIIRRSLHVRPRYEIGGSAIHRTHPAAADRRWAGRRPQPSQREGQAGAILGASCHIRRRTSAAAGGCSMFGTYGRPRTSDGSARVIETYAQKAGPRLVRTQPSLVGIDVRIGGSPLPMIICIDPASPRQAASELLVSQRSGFRAARRRGSLPAS
jgi:hypothetical protein